MNLELNFATISLPGLHLVRGLWSADEGMGLTFAKECEEIIMKGLTGERKRWPVLINRRRDTPKVSHSQAHNGVLHQAEPGMEYGRSEWRQGKKKKKERERDSSPHSLCTRLSYCISILQHQPQAHGPIVHVPFSDTVFRGSHWSVL